jgi:hypothetical protein
VGQALGNGARGPALHNPLHGVIPGANDLAIVVQQIGAVKLLQRGQASAPAITPG